MSRKINLAFEIAHRAHKGQKRKYTGVPYVTHCIDVARMVVSVGGDEDMVCAAYLHDTAEDTTWNLEATRMAFGDKVYEYVAVLTNIKDLWVGNRYQRKTIEKLRLGQASAEAQTIKLADLISNFEDITLHDPDFAKVFVQEKNALLTVLGKGDVTLYKKAGELVKEYYEKQ